METFTRLKELSVNLNYQYEKRQVLGRFRDGTLDAPISCTVNDFNRLPYCFTSSNSALHAGKHLHIGVG